MLISATIKMTMYLCQLMLCLLECQTWYMQVQSILQEIGGVLTLSTDWHDRLFEPVAAKDGGVSPAYIAGIVCIAAFAAEVLLIIILFFLFIILFFLFLFLP